MTDLVSKKLLDHLRAYRAGHPEASQADIDFPLQELLADSSEFLPGLSFNERKCASGEVIFHEGEEGKSLYIVKSGQVAILKGDLSYPTILAFHGAGEIFGEMALLDRQPRSATIVALEATWLYELDQSDFERLLQSSPRISQLITRMLSERLRRTSEARTSGESTEKRLVSQVSRLEIEKQHLERLQDLRQETTELILHDLRNPLSTIALSLKMLSMTLPEDILELNDEVLCIAQESAQRMQRLIDSLLEVAQMEMGETQFVLEPFDLEPLIRDVVHRVSILAPSGVVVSCEIEPGLPTIYTDRDKIERVLANLLDNALKYTPEGGKILVRAERRPDEIWVTISDTGPGILAEDRERIFERFTQIPADLVERRGFGLGLAYCRLAIERLSGRIWVESGQDGHGSRFIFTLPLHEN